VGDGQQYKKSSDSASSFFSVEQPSSGFFDQPAAGPVLEDENSVAQEAIGPVQDAPTDNVPLSEFLRPWPNLLSGYLQLEELGQLRPAPEVAGPQTSGEELEASQGDAALGSGGVAAAVPPGDEGAKELYDAITGWVMDDTVLAVLGKHIDHMDAFRASYERYATAQGEGYGDLVADLNGCLGEVAMGQARAYLGGAMSAEDDLRTRVDEGWLESADTEGALEVLREEVKWHDGATAADPERIASLRAAALDVAPGDADYIAAALRILSKLEGTGRGTDAPVNELRVEAAATRVAQAANSSWWGTPSADLAYAALVDLSAAERQLLWTEHRAAFESFSGEDQTRLEYLCTDPDVSTADIVREGLRAAAASGDDAVLAETAEATGAWSQTLHAEAQEAGPGTQAADAWVAMQGAVQDQALGDEATCTALTEAGLLGSLGLEQHHDQLAGYEAMVLAARNEDSLCSALDAVPRSERRAVHTGDVSAHLARLHLLGAPRVEARLYANTTLAEVTADVQAFAAAGQLGRVRTALLRLDSLQERQAWTTSPQGAELLRDRSLATLVTATLWATGDDAADALLRLGAYYNERSLSLDGLAKLSPSSRAALRASALDEASAQGDPLTVARLHWLRSAGLELTELDVVNRLGQGAALSPMGDGASEPKDADFTKEARYLVKAVGHVAGERSDEWIHATDLFSRSAERMSESVLDFALAYRQATLDDGKVSQREYLVLKHYADLALEAGARYDGVRSSLSATASSIAATAAATVVISFSGGMATPAVLAAATACGGAAAGLTDGLLRGQADAEWGENIATGAVDAAFTVLGARLNAAVLKQAEAGAEASAILASVQKAAPKASTKALAEVLDGTLGGIAGETFRASLDPSIWNGGVERGLGALLAAAGRGVLGGSGGALLGMGLGKALSKGFEPFAQVIEHARRHPKAAEFAKALSGALPPDIREGMLAAAEIHVLDDVDKVDAFFEQTGSRTGAAAIWTDGERIVVVARPTATAKDIAEEAIHLEQLFSASKGGAVRELYDAVPDLAAWRALGEAGEYAEQLRLYRLKLDLEIDAHTTIVTRRRALGDLEGVREAEETLGELRKIEARTAAMTGEEAAAAGVLKDEAPWLLAKRARRSIGVEGAGAEAGASQSGVSSRVARRQAMRDADIPTSQQPSGQRSVTIHGPKGRVNVGRQYDYNVPASGGGTQQMSVQHSLTDDVPGHGPHWEAGKVKKSGEADSVGRPKLQNDKAKVDE